MNKLIKKYLYAVTKRVPPNKKDEIQKELEASIYDMLGDRTNPTDIEIENVLHAIGNPILVAAKYQEHKYYVVHPNFYQDYVMVVKYVVLGFAAIGLLSSGIESFITISSNDFVSSPGNIFAEITSNMISQVLTLMLTGFALVTLAFWSYNLPKVKEKIDRYLQNWKASELMDAPAKPQQYKNLGRWEIFFKMFFTLLFSGFFAALFIGAFDQLGWYEAGLMKVQLFNPAVRDLFGLLIMIGLISTFIYYLYYLKNGKKTLGVMVYYSLDSFYSTVVSILFFNYPNLFLQDFIDYAAVQMNITAADLSHYISIGINILTALSIVIFIFDFIVNWSVFVHKNKKIDSK